MIVNIHNATAQNREIARRYAWHERRDQVLDDVAGYYAAVLSHGQRHSDQRTPATAERAVSLLMPHGGLWMAA